MKIISSDEYLDFINRSNVGIFSTDKNAILVNEVTLSADFFRNFFDLIDFLRTHTTRHPLFSRKISEINTGIFDQCLEQYLFDTIDLRKDSFKTCWEKRRLNYRALGFVGRSNSAQESLLKFAHQGDPVAISYFREKAINKNLEEPFIARNGWLYVKTNFDIYLTFREKLKIHFRKILGFPRGKNIKKIVNSIHKSGWDPDLANFPLIGILGYSASSQNYQVISGKHRVASLKYLHKKSLISDDTVINYPVLIYPFHDWRNHSVELGGNCNCGSSFS